MGGARPGGHGVTPVVGEAIVGGGRALPLERGHKAEPPRRRVRAAVSATQLCRLESAR